MIFEVTPDEIAILNDTDLRTLVGLMAEQEAIKHGCSPVGVTYGGHQNAGDGGIDVRATVQSDEISGYIPKEDTGFQVKAEDLARKAVIDEMRPDGELRDSIKELAEKNGAYVIVSSKGSVSDSSLKKRREAMREAISDLEKASQLFTDFYDRQRITTWVNQTPGLIPWVKERVGKPLSGWQPFGDWSSSPLNTDDEYLADDHLRLLGAGLGDSGSLGVVDGINQLRNILTQPKGAIRLVGLSGVGKTKMVQAIFDERLGDEPINPGFAIYTDLADHPDPVPIELLTQLQNLNQRCVLIVDNCGIELHRKLVSRLQKANAHISVITIEYDIADETPEKTDVFKLEPASNEVIEKILGKRYTNLSNPEIRTISEFSEGNFRIALALAETARQGESLTNLNDSELFKRLFRQRNEDNPALYRAAMICSLVYSFDYETLEGEDAELPILAGLAEQTVGQFHAHIAELSRRQLAQQRSNWRALLPHAIAHRLAKQALQDLPLPTILNVFTKQKIPDRLLKSFSRRIGCLHDSQEAQEIVAQWLAEDGWLSDVGNLNDLGHTLLDNVAPVNPEATLQCLERAALGDAPLYEIGNQKQQSIIRLLRSLAYDAGLFSRATNLIVGFTKNGEESNNLGDAINVFASLFSLYLSGTKAGPTERANAILALARTGHERDSKLALAALGTMLETDHFSSSYGFEFGTRKRDYGHDPRNRDDIREWFGAAIDVCHQMVKLPHIKMETRDKIGHRFARLVAKTGMTDELVAVADALHSDGSWPQGWVAARGALRRIKDTERKEEIVKIEQLIGRLAPQTLKERIGSYILPKGWSPLDVVDIDFDDDNKYKEAEKLANDIAADIGKELASDLSLLAEHLPYLAPAESYRLVSVFKAIGENVEDVQAAWSVIKPVCIDTIGKTSYSLAGLFVAGAANRDRDFVEEILDEALLDEELHPLFVNMQINAGLNKAGIERLVTATQIPNIPTNTFHHLSYRIEWEDYNPDDFERVLDGIAAREGGVPLAFSTMEGLVYSRQHDKKPLNEIEKKIGKKLITETPFDRSDDIKGHKYKIIAEACLDTKTDSGLAELICENMFSALNEYKIYAHDFVDFVGVLAEKFPQAVLNGLIGRASDQNEIPELFESRRIAKLNPASKLSADAIFEWVQEDIELRSLAIAHVIPIWERMDAKETNPSPLEEYVGPVEWAATGLKLLALAPEKKPVLNTMVDRFRPTGWSGSLAAIMESRLPLLEGLLTHSDAQIVKAATEAIGRYIEAIDAQKDWEAIHDRARDERFEW